MSLIPVPAAMQAATRGFYPKTIEGSLRFNDDDSAYLSWTPVDAGDDSDTWTFSAWVKRGTLGSTQILFAQGPNANDRTFVRFESNDQIRMRRSSGGGGTVDWSINTTQLFRDVSAWYHIVITYEYSASSSDRVRLYVNGSRVSDFVSTPSYPDATGESDVNTTDPAYLGSDVGGGSYFDGYLAEVHLTDGTAYDADAFGELKNNLWVAKTPDVTYGTNGFYLNFQDDTEVESFNTVLWRGSGSQQSITGMGFKPDFLWIKNRSTSNNHQLMNSVVGLPNNLESNTTDAEDTTNRVSSFDSDGFTVEGNYSFTNQSGESYVAWGWKAGGSSNTYNVDGTGYASMAAAGLTDGTAVLTGLSVSTTYGFSISTFNSGSSGTQSFAHGLGTTPSLCIFKERNSGGAGDHWVVWEGMTGNPATSYGYLNLTNAFGTDASQWSNTAPTSTTFTFNSGYAWSTSQDMIAYCWAEKSGYSKFGTYTSDTGNVSITTGFRPAIVIIKSTNNASQWEVIDNTRDTVSPHTKGLRWNSPNNEFDYVSDLGQPYIDFTDTGFTITGQGDTVNLNTWQFIYAAFADTREAAFWLDQSGNDNDWQPVNLDHNDTVADSPTDNFATFNPLTAMSTITLSEGNLKAVVPSNESGYYSTVYGTTGFSSGKFYWEATTSSSADGFIIGIDTRNTGASLTSNAIYNSGTYGYRFDNGNKWVNGTQTSFGPSSSVGDIIGIAIDMDAGTFKVYKNGSLVGTLATGITGTAIPLFQVWYTVNAHINFGQQPFKYDPPA